MKKTKRVKAEATSLAPMREILSVGLLAFAVFLFLCLVSYSPEDPAWRVAVHGEAVRNLVGRVGAYTADILILLFGVLAYLPVIACLFVSAIGLRLFSLAWSKRQSLGLILSLFSLPVFAELVLGVVQLWDRTLSAGGLWGKAMAQALVLYLNRWGTLLLVLAAFFIGMSLMTHGSLERFFKRVIKWTCVVCVKLWHVLSSQIELWTGRLLKAYRGYRRRTELARAKTAELPTWSARLAAFVRDVKHLAASAKNVAASHETPISTATPVLSSLSSVNDVHVPLQDKPLQASKESAKLKRDSDKSRARSTVQPDFEKETKDASGEADDGSIVDSTFGETQWASELPLDVKIKRREDDLKKKRTADQGDQLNFLPPVSGEFVLPPASLLDYHGQGKVEIDEASLRANAMLLETKLKDFGVDGAVTEIHPGPVITMYEFVPAPGVKINRVVNLSDDLSLAIGGRQVRIVAPLPDKAAIGIEIPNIEREVVSFREIIEHPKFKREKSKLLFALGKDISGESFVSDLTKMPHLLVAGATGAGKSVSINTMILSLLHQASPEEVRLLMVDPKMLELSVYQGIPHLLLPVVTDPKKAAMALRWAVKEMERRYQLMADINARNIINYNKRIEDKEHVGRSSVLFKGEPISHDQKFPYIVIIIDELADLMIVAGKEVEEQITRLAQMARAAGIHLILATQRPSVDVLTGVIKANFPSRISFKVSSKYDARTILDTIGSEQLLGAGDMLFLPPGSSRLLRIHGAYVSENEIARVVEFLKKQGTPDYREEEILNPALVLGGEAGDSGDDHDELYDAAVAIVSETKQASISLVQRRLRIGYNRAARLIEKMEAEGVVSPPQGSKGREVLVGNLR